MIKKILILLFIFFSCFQYLSFSEESSVDLVKKLNIYSTNKIFIERGVLEPKKQLIRIEITDSQIIESILQELKSVKIMSPCDCIAEYSIGFYNNDSFLNSINYSSELVFLRYEGDNNSDYIPSAKFNDLIKEQLESKVN